MRSAFARSITVSSLITATPAKARLLGAVSSVRDAGGIVEVQADGAWRSFRADVGVNDDCKAKGPLRFQFMGTASLCSIAV